MNYKEKSRTLYKLWSTFQNEDYRSLHKCSSTWRDRKIEAINPFNKNYWLCSTITTQKEKATLCILKNIMKLCNFYTFNYTVRKFQEIFSERDSVHHLFSAFFLSLIHKYSEKLKNYLLTSLLNKIFTLDVCLNFFKFCIEEKTWLNSVSQKKMPWQDVPEVLHFEDNKFQNVVCRWSMKSFRIVDDKIKKDFLFSCQ